MFIFAPIKIIFSCNWNTNSYRRMVLTPIYLIVLVAATGCIEFRQEIELESATRGSFRIEIKIPEQLAKAAEMQPEFAHYLDPVKGTASYKGKGVRIRKYRVYNDDGFRVIRIIGDIDDFKKVVDSGCLGTITQGKDGGNNRLTFSLSETVTSVAAVDREKAFKGLKLGLILETPGAIVATSGKKTEEKEVEWVFDADKDSEFLTAPPKLFVDYK